jgi:D-serine dehydratase
VLLELGLPGGRTGCRTHDEAAALAVRLHASTAVKLVVIECYEGLGAKGNTEADAPFAAALMDRVDAIARLCDAQHLFDADEVLLSAGGSAIFDLVATRLTPALSRPVRGSCARLLRHPRPRQLQALPQCGRRAPRLCAG